MRHAPVLVLVLPAVLAAAGCKKKTERPSTPPPLDAAPVEAASSAEATPEPDAPPSFTPGELVVGAPLGDLGIIASYPKNLTLRIEGNRAELSAPGFYPVRITVEPLTLENAVMKISVNGVPQLTPGTTYDGQVKVYQTNCLLVRCLVDHPSPYRAEVAEVGRAICESIAEVPPPTEGYLRQLRDNSYSFGGPCRDEDRGRQATFQAAVGLAKVKDAVAACWRDAAAARPDWRAAQPVVRVGWNLSDANPPRWKVMLDDLEGDTTALQTCLEQALEPARAALPADVRTAPGCIATFTAAYDLDHRPTCPGTANPEPAEATPSGGGPAVGAGRDSAP